MKLISTSELLAVATRIKPGARVVTQGNFATPRTLLELFDSSVERYRLIMGNAQEPLPHRDGVTHEATFQGPGVRRKPDTVYIPCRLSMMPRLFETELVPDVVLLNVTPARDGLVSMGTDVTYVPAAIEAVRARGGLVIAQINPALPYTFGDALVRPDDIDYAIEAEEAPKAAQSTPGDDVAEEIGHRVAALVPPEATLQLGIGAVPDAAVRVLRTRQNLKIFTEMLSDGVLDLARAGALAPGHPITASFVYGSDEVYDWIDGNPDVQMLRLERSNNPTLIASQPRMTSINGALQVDLYDQANGTWVNGQPYSGLGGATDFMIGALHSPGGAAVIALRSWHPKADCSTIVPELTSPVTSFQHSAVVTEHGTARLFGRSSKEQARVLIEDTAHPDARDQLWAAAAAMGLRS